MDVMLEPGTEAEAPEGPAALALAPFLDADNICDILDDGEVMKIGQLAQRDYDTDVSSRSDWLAKYKRAMDVAMQVREDKNFPWAKASNIKYPLLTTSAIQFQARAYPAIVDGQMLVKGKVLGPDEGVPAVDAQGQQITNAQGQPLWKQPPGAKRARADRMGAHMSWQLLYDMPQWEEETDRLLLMLPIVGCVFRKTYYDAIEKRPMSVLVSAEDFFVNYRTTSLRDAPVQSHRFCLYPHEIEERVRAGLWRPTYTRKPDDDSQQIEFVEQQRRIDLDGDGYAEPYIVTFCVDGGCEGSNVARIVANYTAEDVELTDDGAVLRIKPAMHIVKYGFIPAPDGSFYDIGFGFLLDDLSSAVSSILNQSIDAGTLQNAQGGFIGSAVNIRGGSMSFTLGEWKRVDTGGLNLRENIVPLNLPGPSGVQLNMLELLIGAAKEITSVQDIMTGDATSASTPVGTVYAMIEQGMKVMTSIFKRIHRSFGHELRMLRRLNRLHLDERVYFELNDTPGLVERADYEDDGLDVMPVSDPSQATDLQKMARAQYLGMFRGDPNVNQRELTLRQLEAGGVPDIPKLMQVGEPAPDPRVLLDGMKQANDRMRAKAEVRASDAKVAADLANAAKTLAEAGATLGNLGLIQFGQDLATIAEDTMRQVAAAQAEEETDEDHGGEAPDGGGMAGMAGPSGDVGIPGADAGPAGGPAGALGEGPFVALPAGGPGGIDGAGAAQPPLMG